MSCCELDRMRHDATALKDRIHEQHRKARATVQNDRFGRISGKSEMVPFLQRKLQRLADKIEYHVAAHQCQD